MISLVIILLALVLTGIFVAAIFIESEKYNKK